MSDIPKEFAEAIESIRADSKEEGARRMQNYIVTLLTMKGHMDDAPMILALDPKKICEGESIKETFKL